MFNELSCLLHNNKYLYYLLVITVIVLLNSYNYYTISHECECSGYLHLEHKNTLYALVLQYWIIDLC